MSICWVHIVCCWLKTTAAAVCVHNSLDVCIFYSSVQVKLDSCVDHFTANGVDGVRLLVSVCSECNVCNMFGVYAVLLSLPSPLCPFTAKTCV